MQKRISGQKLLSVALSILFVVYSLVPNALILSVHAEESAPSEAPTTPTVISETPTDTLSPTSEPTSAITPTPSGIDTPTPSISDSPTPTISATLTPTSSTNTTTPSEVSSSEANASTPTPTSQQLAFSDDQQVSKNDWIFNPDGSYTTSTPVGLGKTYTSPFDSNIK